MRIKIRKVAFMLVMAASALLITGIFIFKVSSGLLLAAMVIPKTIFSDGPPPGTGDPDNVRLSELRSDPIFNKLPPNARLVIPIVSTPAKYRKPAFEPAGWDGPAISLTFVSNEPIGAVYQFYIQEASIAGWRAGNVGADGYTHTWTKTYNDGAGAGASLFRRDSNTSEYTYILSGGIAAIDAAN